MLRGLTKKQEQDPAHLIRDTRTIGMRVRDFFSDAVSVTVVMVTLGTAAFLVPAIVDLVLIMAIIIFLYNITRKHALPFRMPMRSGALDYNDLKPGSRKPYKARGICLFGNEQGSNEELWFNNDDMRTHVLIFGSTGSGKTVTLTSLAYNALVQGSGFIYVDGKGDNTLFSNIFSMVRSVGREDDILLINFMTGARDIIGPQEKRLSNTLNPFAQGSSSMLSQLVTSLMDSSSQSSDGDMWKGRAIAFIESLMKVLVYARDKEWILLDANTIRNYFHLDRIEAMAIDLVFPRNDQEGLSLADAPENVMEPLKNYILTLPGYDKAKKGKQVSQVFEQHGFITMQLVRVFTSLADTYGHILRTKLAEVDLKDVVLNRRILLVLLPALEKSPDELSNLGKIIIATLKAMMAAGLGENVEGSYQDLIQRKPTNCRTPFMCIMDEYGYYAVPGFAVVPAQARSLGFSAIFAGQDLPAFQRASKEEAASIGANTNIKIAMKLEDPTETWEFFSKTAGESYVTKVDYFQTNPSSMLNNYLDTRSSSAEKRARIDLLDLKEQAEGEMHIFFKSRIIRARSFYANPQPVKEMRLNHFLKVEAPSLEYLVERDQCYQSFAAAIDNPQSFEPASSDQEEMSPIFENLNQVDKQSSIERGVATLLAYHNREQPEDVVDVDDLPHSEINIFTPLRMTEIMQSLITHGDLEQFSQPLLRRSLSAEHMQNIERMSGRSGAHADNIANEIIKDMEVATHYPPTSSSCFTADELTTTIKNLNQHIHQVVSYGAGSILSEEPPTDE